MSPKQENQDVLGAGSGSLMSCRPTKCQACFPFTVSQKAGERDVESTLEVGKLK